MSAPGPVLMGVNSTISKHGCDEPALIALACRLARDIDAFPDGSDTSKLALQLRQTLVLLIPANDPDTAERPDPFAELLKGIQ